MHFLNRCLLFPVLSKVKKKKKRKEKKNAQKITTLPVVSRTMYVCVCMFVIVNKKRKPPGYLSLLEGF